MWGQEGNELDVIGQHEGSPKEENVLILASNFNIQVIILYCISVRCYYWGK